MNIKRQVLAHSLLLMSFLAALAGCDGDTQAPSSSQGSVSTQASTSSQTSSSSAGAVTGEIDPAPVAIRRLSKVEYNNTVRDLLGTDLKLADDFPLDNYSVFDASVEATMISPSHLAWYHKNAASLAKIAVISAQDSNRDVINCDLEQSDCAQTVIDAFGLRAWRRPITTDESERLMAFYNEAFAVSSDRAAAMQTLIQGIILSPNFIFRPEIDQDLHSREPRELNSYELASRLSYFLWGSMPDAELFEKAANDTLRDEQILSAEVARMLDSPKAKTLTSVFVAEWLGFEGEANFGDPSSTSFSGLLDVSIKLEPIFFISHIIKNNFPVTEIVTADYTFLNNLLAFHYDQAGVFRPVSDDDLVLDKHVWYSPSDSRGIFRQLWFLNKYDNVVARELWVEQRLQCEHPDWLGIDSEGSQLELSKVAPPRTYMSALEQAELLPIELSDCDACVPGMALCAIQYGMTYALGRKLDTFHYSREDFFDARDANAVYSVYENTKDTGNRMQDIFTEIVLSPVFRYRRGADSNVEAQ